ncbi:hypothetical protein [Streptomyces virginiae]|uniref:hypothetical protein n=1 Tax=Streptomyces virginiae TaxID=1961 RepID=UPI00225576B7|nr:hypothetical protein [Streptomyces virginiae]MCX5278227.1 hypothetical protein [Streptomyces virginiae]
MTVVLSVVGCSNSSSSAPGVTARQWCAEYRTAGSALPGGGFGPPHVSWYQAVEFRNTSDKEATFRPSYDGVPDDQVFTVQPGGEETAQVSRLRSQDKGRVCFERTIELVPESKSPSDG